jgi:FAD synthase
MAFTKVIKASLKIEFDGGTKNLESAVFTFWPHPRTVFNPNDDLKLLNTIDEKTYLLEKNGVQNLFLKEFDEAFRNLTGEEFVNKSWSKNSTVKHLIIGYDHTFGKNKSGDFSTFYKKWLPNLVFEVEQVEAVDFHDKHISSTQIRNALSVGNVKEAAEMLGYVYSVSGEVVHGKKSEGQSVIQLRILL